MAVICLSLGQKVRNKLPIDFITLRLKKRTFIPIKTQPFQTFQNGLRGFIGGARLVGIFYAEHKDTALLPGKKPIEKGGPGPADMQISGRAGGEAGSYFDHGRVSIIIPCQRQPKGEFS
jgi:hypothetical protein